MASRQSKSRATNESSIPRLGIIVARTSKDSLTPQHALNSENVPECGSSAEESDFTEVSPHWTCELIRSNVPVFALWRPRSTETGFLSPSLWAARSSRPQCRKKQSPSTSRTLGLRTYSHFIFANFQNRKAIVSVRVAALTNISRNSSAQTSGLDSPNSGRLALGVNTTAAAKRQ
jgi:hypothetical protein